MASELYRARVPFEGRVYEVRLYDYKAPVVRVWRRNSWRTWSWYPVRSDRHRAGALAAAETVRATTRSRWSREGS